MFLFQDGRLRIEFGREGLDARASTKPADRTSVPVQFLEDTASISALDAFVGV